MLPAAPAGRGLTRAQRLRRRVGRTLAGAGFVEVISYPVRRRRPTSTRSACPADDPRRRRVRLANPLQPRSRAARRRCCPGCSRPLARNVGRGHADVGAVRDRPVVLPAPATRPAPILRRRPPARPTTSGRRSTTAVPDQPLHLAVVLTGERERAGWWGPGRAGGLGRRGRGRPRRRPARSASSSRSRPPSRAPVAPRPLRRAAVVGERGRRPRRRAAPAGLRGLRAAAAHGRAEIDLDALMRHARGRRAGAGLLDVPGRQGGRRARRRRRVPRRGRGGRAARGRGRAAGVGPALRRLHRRPGAARAASRWRSRCGSAPRTAR